MIVVHHLGISQSDRIVWLCEELGLDYELVRHERDPVTRLAPASYRALHPSGTAPVITDGDLVLGESAAIIEYLARKYGGGRLFVSPDEPNFADFLYWFHFANGSMLPSAMMPMVVKMVTGGSDTATFMSERLERNYTMLEDRLGVVPWLAGDEFTAADIMIAFPLTTMRLFSPRDLAPYPNIRAYLARIAERPAFTRAMHLADPDLVLPMA